MDEGTIELTQAQFDLLVQSVDQVAGCFDNWAGANYVPCMGVWDEYKKLPKLTADQVGVVWLRWLAVQLYSEVSGRVGYSIWDLSQLDRTRLLSSAATFLPSPVQGVICTIGQALGTVAPGPGNDTQFVNTGWGYGDCSPECRNPMRAAKWMYETFFKDGGGVPMERTDALFRAIERMEDDGWKHRTDWSDTSIKPKYFQNYKMVKEYLCWDFAAFFRHLARSVGIPAITTDTFVAPSGMNWRTGHGNLYFPADEIFFAADWAGGPFLPASYCFVTKEYFDANAEGTLCEFERALAKTKWLAAFSLLVEAPGSKWAEKLETGISTLNSAIPYREFFWALVKPPQWALCNCEKGNACLCGLGPVFDPEVEEALKVSMELVGLDPQLWNELLGPVCAGEVEGSCLDQSEYGPGIVPNSGFPKCLFSTFDECCLDPEPGDPCTTELESKCWVDAFSSCGEESKEDTNWCDVDE